MIQKMDVRCGIDIVDISRILKKVNDGNAPFINKCFTEDEIKYCESANNADKKAERYAARFAAKEAVEDVVDAEAAAEEIGHVDAAPAEASGSIGIAVTVVVGTLALVGEDGIGLVDLFELLLGIGGVVDVGMELSCELQERPLDRLLVGVALNAEDLVEIAL